MHPKSPLTPEQEEAKRDYYRAYRAKNWEKLAAYRKAHPPDKEANAAARKRYKEKIKIENPDYDRNYREANAERISAQRAKYREANREVINLKLRQHFAKPDQQEKRRIYKNERYRSNPVFKISHACRNRVNKAIKRQGLKKTTKTAKLLGCSWEILRAHIEKQFVKGMSWENRTLWHVDHIIPLSSAKTMEELVPLMHFSNLRPLWAEENMLKRDAIITCQPELLLHHL